MTSSNDFNTDIENLSIQSVQYFIADDGSIRFISPYLASSNFDGSVPIFDGQISASSIQKGMFFSLDGLIGSNYYPVVQVNYEDPDLSGVPATQYTITYLDSSNQQQSITYNALDIINVRYDNWNEKYLGTQGWTLTSGGNAIFTNVGVRGEIEATTLDVGGTEGITYDGTTVTIGASVVINAALTVGASGNFIVSGSAAQDIISNNTTITGGNIATGRIKSSGYSGPGTGSAFSTAGMSINLDDGSIAAPNFKIDNGGNAHFKGTVQSASGNLAGFILSASQISIAGFTMSTSSGIYLGNNQQFKVNIQGNLVANSASIIGDINAKSGKFTGSVTIESGGSLTIGTTAQKVVIDNNGFNGYNQLGLPAVIIPTDGSDPKIGKFKVLETGIVSDTSAGGANIIVGTMTSSATTASVVNGIVLRGNRLSGNTIALYTVSSGSATTYNSGNGFYIDESAQFKLSGNNGFIKFDGNNLTISGNINATSGSFSGYLKSSSVIGGLITGASVVGSFITGQQIVGGTIVGASGTFTGDLVATRITASAGNIGGFTITSNSLNANNFAVSTIGGLALGSASQFYVDTAGNLIANSASLIGNIIATSGKFSGSVVVASIFGASVNGGIISSGSFVGGMLQSSGYSGVVDGSAFSTTGTNLNLNTGAITSKQFRIDSSGNATFGGALNAATGTFTGNLSANQITSGSITGRAISGTAISGGTITGANIFTSLFTLDAPNTSNPATIIGSEITAWDGLGSNIGWIFDTGNDTFTHNAKSWTVDSSYDNSSIIRDQLYKYTGQDPYRSFIIRSGTLLDNTSSIINNGASIELRSVPGYSLGIANYQATSHNFSGGNVTYNQNIIINGPYSITGIGSGLTQLNATNLASGTVPTSRLTGTYSIGITGNAGTVTNGVYTTGTYNNPSWITALGIGKITGIQAGTATTPATSDTVTVNFPTAFSATPLVVATSFNNASYYIAVTGVTATSASLRAIHRDSTGALGYNVTLRYIAMLPS